MATWNDNCTKTKYPGIYRTPTGYRVRIRALDPRTGKLKEACRNLDGATLDQAIVHQAELRQSLLNAAEPSRQRPRFVEFATSLTERKLANRELQSPATRVQWAHVLDAHLIPAFGDMWIDSIRRQDIEDFKAKQLRPGVSPHTVNGRLRVLLTVLRAAVGELELERDPTRGVKPVDTSAWVTYSEEEPNSLTAQEVVRFLEAVKRVAPNHYAMLALGFATGRRPSELRPLRRRGPQSDVLWDQGVVLIRRSSTRGDVMDKTKTVVRLRIPLPPALMEILRDHVERLTGRAAASDLLFPSDTGGFRAETALTKPIAKALAAAKIRKHITPRAMRRTYQDLARQAQVHDFVTRAISGHAHGTGMHEHYSTVTGDEMLEGLSRIASLAGLGASGGEVGDQVVIRTPETRRARQKR